MTTQEYNQSVDQFSDNLYRFALKNMRDEEKAKDIVQDTFERLWMKVTDVNFEKVKSYLFTTAYNAMVDLSRREKKVGEYNETKVRRMGHNEQYSDLKEILNEALQKLPEIQRSVVMLRDYEGYNYEEIGEITNLNESQVKVYIFRARKFLKEYIGSMEAVI
ncbi:MAG TPA: RNA polymerase sigma factor [Flavobacteriales bacterium]|nr:RNA polymerase sigma factor [Flavobacteriales bacterium]HRE73769.1 RNA polymerase sigma factor [Flavobacteriales bacterium]HRE95668.1 RNA polymerase sigma factor [Flavobacteriales bacterium]HRJ39690.1 RNA polymerase sigma factor [Flavobacteriales bacterium]